MGYGYKFHIALEDLDSIPNFEQTVLPYLKAHYLSLTKREWFPKFGEADTSGARGYGTGEKQPLLYELVLFTSQFPQLTFTIFLFYWDCTNLTTYQVKGDKLLNKWIFNTESLPFGKSKLTICMDNIDIDNDITKMLNN